MELKTVRESFEHVVEKREVLSLRCHKLIDTIIDEVEQALSRLQSNKDPTVPKDVESMRRSLKSKLPDPEKELKTSKEELQSSASKHVELLKKVLISDLSKGYRVIDFDVQILNQIIADHIIRQCPLDIVDSLMVETSTPEANLLGSRFSELYPILDALRKKNIQPARDWISTNHETLQAIGSSLELKILKVQFVELLAEIIELLTHPLYTRRLEKCPKSQLLAQAHQENLANAVTHDFCLLAGLPSRPTLTVALEAALEALPTILKAMELKPRESHDWQAKKQLPFPVDLSNHFQFHTRFIDPVTRIEVRRRKYNPPISLPCGHVTSFLLILDTATIINDISKVECPICSLDAEVPQCRQLIL